MFFRFFSSCCLTVGVEQLTPPIQDLYVLPFLLILLSLCRRRAVDAADPGSLCPSVSSHLAVSL